MKNAHSHAPQDYSCPFCAFIAGGGDRYTQQQDIVFRNEYTTVVVAPRWWVNNPGSLLVVPNKHFENIYDIPEEDIAEVYKTAKKMAIAIRESYGCDGTSMRQHNEPAGGQDAWHFHVQVLPRYDGDNLYVNNENNTFVDADARAQFVQKLRPYFENQSS
jgi:histidine triad (HIT) family protein